MDKRSLVLAATVMLAACGPKGQALYDRAEQSLHNGNSRAAVIDLKSLLQDEPANARARLLLSQAMLESGDVDGAAIEIDKARSLGAKPDELLLADCRLWSAKADYGTVVEKCMPGAEPAATPDLRIVHAQGLLGLDRTEEAMAEFQDALKAKPDSLEALTGLAVAQYIAGAPEDAQQTFDGAPDGLKKRPTFWLSRGGLAMRAGDYAAAEKAFEQASALADQDPGSRERVSAIGGLAESQIRQGKLEASRKTTEELTKLAPRNPYAKILRAQVLAAGGSYEEARTLLEEVVASDPKNHNARIMLGMTQLQLGNPGQAEMHFSNVVANQPGNIQAQKLLAQTRSRMGGAASSLDSLKSSLTDGESNPELLALAGRLSLASGDRGEALKYLERAEKSSANASSPDAFLDIAKGYLDAGETERALQTLESATATGSAELRRRYAIANIHISRGEREKAQAEAQEILKVSSESVEGRNAAASIYMTLGQRDLARAQLEAVRKAQPKSASALLNLARLEIAEGRTDVATSLAEEARAASPGNVPASLLLALIERQRKNSAGVAKWLETAVKENPGSVEAHVAAGEYFLSTREFDRAREYADRAGKTAPANAAIFNLRGLALLGTGDRKAAIASFKQAVDMAPDYPGFAVNLARAQSESGDAVAARTTLDAILKSAPGNAQALAIATGNSLNAGDIQAAGSYMKRLEAVAPDAPQVQILKADIAVREKRFAEALASYEKASAVLPSSRLALASYGAARMAGKDDPARYLRDWLAGNPKDLEVRVAMAEFLANSGDYKAAAREYEAGLKFAPESPILLNNLALIYDRLGDPRGLDHARRAWNMQQSNPAIQDTYGWLLVRSGKVDQGLDLLRQSAKAIPGSMEVQYHLASALARKGDKGAALAALDAAAKGQGPASAKADVDRLRAELSK